MKGNTGPILAFISGLLALLLSIDIQIWGNVHPVVAVVVAVGATIFSLFTLVMSPSLRWLSTITLIGSAFMALLNFLAAAGGM